MFFQRRQLIQLNLFIFSDSNDSTSFSALHKNLDLSANEFDVTYAGSDFLLDENQSLDNKSTLTSEAAANKRIKKLVEKTRQNVRQLGICLKVHDPSKMLNVLVTRGKLR